MSLPLPEIAPHLPGALVPEPSWPALRAAAGDLPDVASTFYLERPLGAGADRVDLLACVAAEGGAPERLAAWCLRRGWERLHAFAEEWARPGTLLHRQVPFVWMEMDAPYQRPNLLLCTDPSPLERYRGPQPEIETVAAREALEEVSERNRAPRPETLEAWRLDLVERAAELLLGAPLSREALSAVRTCHQALPPGGSIVHLSIMSARSPAALKLNAWLPRERLRGYLRDIGWPGDPDAIEAGVDRFAPGSPVVRLDVTPGSARLGLELFRPEERRRDPSRDALLDTCLAAGLCTPEQRAALRGWPGSERVRGPGGEWPARVSRWTDAKIVFHGGELLAAKAYLGVSSHFSLC